MSAEKILVVDDDDDILLIVQTILATAGYETFTARNGREGVDMALELQPDLILLDVMMPELSGWEVCTTLKNAPETRQIPVAMLTVKSEIRDLITGMQVGADEYITKPFTRRRLLSTVRKLLDERREAAALAYLPSENEDVRFRNLLFDPITELPTVPVIIDALRDRLLDSRDLGVLVVDVEQYSHIEDAYGWEVFDGLLRATGKALRRMLGTLFAAEDFVAVNRAGGSDFYVFATLEAEDADARLLRKARQVEESLRGTLDEAFGSRIHKRIGVFVGHTVLQPNPQMRVERLVYRALRQAIQIASTKEGERQSRLRETFKEILRRRRIRTVYQPIYDLGTMAVYGHEALTRGPVDTAFESPELLFEFAGQHEATWDLEQLCIESSAGGYAEPEARLLFLNVEADSVMSLASRPAALAPLERLRHQVILEVTERSAIRDVPVFREALAVLRQQGFRIAIDDAGSGYASLQSIAELRPNFLKVSNTLVTGLHADTIKRDVVEMLVNLAHRIDAVCVAEGIETPEDLHECGRLGIPYGQGYYLGVPESVPATSPARAIPVERLDLGDA
jgi:EAL domain-containing protein (putative c-di-GMP-specific phosphodiesterase class I)/DNA-binding response OmpR family regulator